MTKNLIVQKFGGTSVGSIERIKKVAEQIHQTRQSGKNIAVVVSAMAGETDRLLNLAGQICDHPSQREIDVLLSSGERVSSSLLTMALNSLGCPAISLTGRQMGLLTDSSHTRARIKQIDAGRAKTILKKNHVVVVAGFQGINEQGDVTTLGRGGSDTSAVALAAALGAERCEIYTDVTGVFTADPRWVPEARKLHVVSYEEMLEMASLGAKVLQMRSVEFARNHNMPLIVRSSFYNEEEGTLICKEDPKMEQPVVSGVMYDKNQSKVTVVGVPDQPGIAAKIFGALSDAALSVDMIIQNVSAEGLTDISFTLETSEVKEATAIMKKVCREIRAKGVSYDSKISKVSIVGAGMRSHSGVAAKLFKIMSGEKINVMMISTSEIRISCIIDTKHTKRAVQALHEGFDLKSEPVVEPKRKRAKSTAQPKAKAV